MHWARVSIEAFANKNKIISTPLHVHVDGILYHMPSDCIVLLTGEREGSEWGVIGERPCEREESCLYNTITRPGLRPRLLALALEISFALKSNSRKLINLTSLKPSINFNIKTILRTHFEK